MEVIERALCPTLALNVMMSDLDGQRLQALAPGSPTLAVPNGTDIEFLTPAGDDSVVPGRVVFLGPTYMFPNLDAVEFFLAESWPAVRRQLPTASFHLIGRVTEEHKARFTAHEGVSCQGFVPDIRPHLSEAAVCVVPLRVGGGTRLKILDAWAMGKAVVATTIGCEGLEAQDGENILIRDDPAEFSQAVLQVLGDRTLRARLGRNGRATAESTYSWEVVGEGLRGAYRRLMS